MSYDPYYSSNPASGYIGRPDYNHVSATSHDPFYATNPSTGYIGRPDIYGPGPSRNLSGRLPERFTKLVAFGVIAALVILVGIIAFVLISVSAI